jgi:hypothetical protein
MEPILARKSLDSPKPFLAGENVSVWKDVH